MTSRHTKPAEADFRMVLVGKTGAGKSETGNTILRKRVFKSGFSSSSVTSTCQKEEEEFEGKFLSVVDTPSLCYTNKSKKEIVEEITLCISYLAPGPHVFLMVVQPGRFTKEKQETLKEIKNVFGEMAARYTMVLFTHGDDLEAAGTTIEEFIHENKTLRDFMQQFGGRYHVFNNRNQDPSQVQELLEKINTMVRCNGGSFYTCEILEEAEKAIKEEMERLLRENPGMMPEEARRPAERSNRFIKAAPAALAGASGSAGGAAGGAAGGTAFGAAAGAFFGTWVGLAATGATLIAAKENKCVIQ